MRPTDVTCATAAILAAMILAGASGCLSGRAPASTAPGPDIDGLPTASEVPPGWTLLDAAQLPAFFGTLNMTQNPADLGADKLREVADNVAPMPETAQQGRIAVYWRGDPNETLSFVALRYAKAQDPAAWRTAAADTPACATLPFTGIVRGADATLVLGRQEHSHGAGDRVFVAAVTAQRSLAARAGATGICEEAELAYLLQVHLRPDPYEPNNSPAEATALGNGYSAMVLRPGDEDWFFVNVTVPATTIVWATGDGARLNLTLHDANGTLLAKGTVLQGGTVLCEGFRAGRMLVRVAAFGGEEVLRYTITPETTAERKMQYCVDAP